MNDRNRWKFRTRQIVDPTQFYRQTNGNIQVDSDIQISNIQNVTLTGASFIYKRPKTRTNIECYALNET